MDFESNRSFRFNQDSVDRACRWVAGRSGRWVWRDASPEGRQLAIIAGPRGAVFYRVGRDRVSGGGVKRQAIGRAEGPDAISLSEARQRCLELRGGSAASQPGRRRGSKVGCTIGRAWDGYIVAAEAGDFSAKGRKRRPLRPATAKDYKSHYSVYMGPFADRDLTWLAENFAGQVSEIGAPSKRDAKPRPSTANKHLQLVANVFDFAASKGWWPGANPCRGTVSRFEVAGREPMLKPDATARLLSAMRAEGEWWADLFTLAALTTRRITNVRTLPWSQVDLDNGRIYFPSSSMKTRKPQANEITPPIRVILERRQAAAASGDLWVFPSPKDRTRPIANPHHAWNRIRDIAGLKSLRIHDLRHLGVSWAAEAGATLPQIMQMAGHCDPRTTLRYMHLGDGAATPALAKVADRWGKAAQAAKKLKLQKPPRKNRSPKGGGS